MHHRSLAALSIAGMLAVTSLAKAPSLHAQAGSTARFKADTLRLESPAVTRLDALSHDRVVQWTTAARAVHCGPAPLSERPGVQAEFARPHVAPLEAAFADAAAVRRAVASLRMKNQR